MTIFYICNQPVWHLATAMWHTTDWHSAGHKTISGAEDMMMRTSSACFCLCLWFRTWLSFTNTQDAGLSPESESQRMEPRFISIYVTYFWSSSYTLTYSWSCEPLTYMVKLKWCHTKHMHCVQAHTNTYIHTHFCNNQVSLSILIENTVCC